MSIDALVLPADERETLESCLRPIAFLGDDVRRLEVAIVAVARKLASLAWRLLASGEDYASASPAQVRLKLRRIELLAGEPSQKGRRTGDSLEVQQERELALAAERAYERLVADWQARRLDRP